MKPRLFLVDVESTGPGPARSVMTEFGVVDYETRSWFHGHLWDFEPTPGNEALPIATQENYGFTATVPEDYTHAGFTGERVNFGSEKIQPLWWVMKTLTSWIDIFEPGRVTFVSDNPGWDFMWMAYAFDSVGMDNRFGHSSRRIGDFAAGQAGDWKKQSGWKSLRKTRHTHNPVDDAMGNAEALEQLLNGRNQ